MRLTEKIKTATSRSNYHTQFAKMSFDEIVDLTTDVLFCMIVGLGLNAYFSVDGDTKYVRITYWLGLVLSFFWIRWDEINLTQRKTPPASRNLDNTSLTMYFFSAVEYSIVGRVYSKTTCCCREPKNMPPLLYCI